jgi:hypothetical protein
MPPKMKLRGVPPGVPPPNDGCASGGAGGVPSPNDGGASGGAGGVPPPNDGCASGGASGGAGIGGDFSSTQYSNYLSSLSELQRRVCQIAESHLETSFDLSRSTGYIAWKAKNG